MLLVNDLCRQAVTSKCMVLRTSGLQRRDFVCLTDVCIMTRHLLELPNEALGDGLFNLGGSWSPTILEMAQRIAGRIYLITGSRMEVSHKPHGESDSVIDFEYSLMKLKKTGFELIHDSHVDQEIDGLIIFCMQNMTVPL